jgi:hypothetical protein
MEAELKQAHTDWDESRRQLDAARRRVDELQKRDAPTSTPSSPPTVAVNGDSAEATSRAAAVTQSHT